MIQGVFKKDLRVTSKEKALEFYKGVKDVILLQINKLQYLRVEPGQHISVVPIRVVEDGFAPFFPSIYDEDGTIAYNHRKHINKYLSAM